MDSESVRGIDRRRLVTWGGLTAAGAPLALVGGPAWAGSPGNDRIPPDTRPGGAYDRYVAGLAAEGRFSGVVLLSHRGRTVLSLAYGMADRERGIRNHEGIAFSLSSAGKPFHAVAVLQLAQQGRLRLTDTVGKHLSGFGKNPGRIFIDAPGDGGFATAPDLVRFARALADGTVLDRPWADVLTAAKIPHGPASFGAYGVALHISNGQWQHQRAGGNPGVGANWSVYPDTGWVAVTLTNRDDVPLVDLLAQEEQAITGAPAGGGEGG